jgi:hypothetical protein
MKSVVKVALFCIVITTSLPLMSMISWEFHDPFPQYTTAEPHEFLYTLHKDNLKGIESEVEHEYASLTISPFGQWAKTAKNNNHAIVPLGDVFGTWNMLALLYGPGCPGHSTPLLDQISTTSYCGTESICTGTQCGVFFNNDQAFTIPEVFENIDPNFGKVSVPLEYRKQGMRAEIDFLIGHDFGIKLQGGVVEIQQTVSAFNDISATGTPLGSNCSPNACCVEQDLANVEQFLTSPAAIRAIANDICLNIHNFRKTALEDIRATLFWRHAFSFNDDNKQWSKFLLIPFVQVTGTLATGPTKSSKRMFAIPHGNNGHESIGFDLGFTLDFADTLEIAVEGGGTFFNTKNKLMRIPTHELQSTIFPCTTCARFKPGNNWHLLATLHARYFLDKLSAYLQLAIIDHEKDCISVKQSSTIFRPDLLVALSPWSVRLLNIGFNYNISPTLSIGFLWQASLQQRIAPRTTTLMASLVSIF